MFKRLALTFLHGCGTDAAVWQFTRANGVWTQQPVGGQVTGAPGARAAEATTAQVLAVAADAKSAG